MPLTTTSGYTFPISGVPTTQDPQSGGLPNSSNSPSNQLKTYSDFNGDWLGYLKYLADNGDAAALDKLLNYMMSEQSSQNARDWQASRDDSAYQRLVQDMKNAGLNPYAFATLNANPISSSLGSGHSYSGNYVSSYQVNQSKLDQNQEKINQNWLKIALSSALPIIGGIIAALL